MGTNRDITTLSWPNSKNIDYCWKLRTLPIKVIPITSSKIKENVQTPGLELKPSHQRLLNSKLKESFSHLQNASDYLGANKVSINEDENLGPVEKFLGYLSGGQDQLLEAKRKLQQLQAQGKKLSPPEMMLIHLQSLMPVALQHLLILLLFS